METSLTDPALWHRIHFGVTITYHYLFPQLTMGLAWFLVGLLASVLVAFPTGDAQAKMVGNHQPAALAAMEGRFEGGRLAEVTMIGQPNVSQQRLENPIPLPGLLSFLAYGTFKSYVKEQVIAAIGPLWSWHEVWLVGTGGVMVMAFPRLMAASFSGCYLALFLILWCVLLRGISMLIFGQTLVTLASVRLPSCRPPGYLRD